MKINTELTNNIYQPLFFRLNKPGDKEQHELLLQDQNKVLIYDEIEGQLRELIKSLNPSIRIKQEEYPDMIEKHLNGTPINDYGVWVYYPWSSKLIHLLDEDEFVEVRTNRNRNKI